MVYISTYSKFHLLLLGSLDTATIVKGMEHWMEHTCLKFEETTNTNQPHLIYVYKSGCWSYMGVSSQTGQEISIGSGCNTVSLFLSLSKCLVFLSVSFAEWE